ncbi:hypothetical protein GOP47_0006703, partial [Adiantum capillus-veneris]
LSQLALISLSLSLSLSLSHSHTHTHTHTHSAHTCNTHKLTGALIKTISRADQGALPSLLVLGSIDRHIIKCREMKLLVNLLLVIGLGAMCCTKVVLVEASCSSLSDGGAAVMSCRSLLQAPAGADDKEAMSGIISVAVPAEIAVARGSRLLGALQAVGHQHYRFNGTAWALYNATAWLYEQANTSMPLPDMGREAVVGVHFYLAQPDTAGGQPSWWLGSSRITAKGVAATTVSSDSITWNLLQATSYQLIVNESSSTDWTWVGEVSSVQRLDTQRGLPPPDTAAAVVGDTFSSVYSALYVFYAASTAV